jgi:hypothetical protein
VRASSGLAANARLGRGKTIGTNTVTGHMDSRPVVLCFYRCLKLVTLLAVGIALAWSIWRLL